MKIEVLGTGCAKCKALEEVVKQAVAKKRYFCANRKSRGHSQNHGIWCHFNPSISD